MAHQQQQRVRGLSVFRPIIYGNTAVLLAEGEREHTDHTHRWTVAVRSAASAADLDLNDESSWIGGADDISSFVKKVTFKLHETYANPLRTVEKPPFEVTETGWGEFDIVIKIFFVPEAAEKPLTLVHHLKLHPWPVAPPAPASGPAPTLARTVSNSGLSQAQSASASAAASPSAAAGAGAGSPSAGGSGAAASTSAEGATGEQTQGEGSPEAAASSEPAVVLSPVHSWQYDEIVFSEPTEPFYSLMLAKPPTALPAFNRHANTLSHILGASGNIGEFTREMEGQEGDRLEKARLETLKEVEDLRKRLLEGEKEVQALRAEVEAKQ